MSSPRPPLSERDVSYLKLLKTLKQSPTLTEGALGVVRRIAAWIDSVAVLNFICTHQAWYDDWEVKEALVHNDRTPGNHRIEIEKAIAIFDQLREMDDPALAASERVEIQEDIKYLFKTLPDHDRAVVKQHAYDLSASRSGKTGAGATVPAAPSATAVAEPLAPAVEDATGAVTEAIRVAEQEAFAHVEEAAATLEPEDVEEPEEKAPAEAVTLAAMPKERKLVFARGSTDDQVLTLLAFDNDDDVLLALLDNPAMNDRIASTIARRATSRVANDLYRRRALFMRPLVREALLECPNAPSTALLEIVNSISDFTHLLKLLRSPKVKFLEVKAKARSRLSMIFKALGQNEKIAALRRAGSGLLKELWTDFFRDEALVVRCVQEKQVDTNIVHEIARSKIAPRRALEIIGTTPQYLANYGIVLELVLNPKTPRQIVQQLMHRLTPADRKMVKNNPALPEAIRRFA
jgi:hypothetical protein